MFGMVFSMKDLCGRLSPTPSSEGLHTIRTDSFALHHFESASGIMFILNTDPGTEDLYQTLNQIYSQIFIECVCRNPLYQHTPDTPIKCPLFVKKLDEFMLTQSFAR